jgi:hypothetical protein
LRGSNAVLGNVLGGSNVVVVGRNSSAGKVESEVQEIPLQEQMCGGGASPKAASAIETINQPTTIFAISFTFNESQGFNSSAQSFNHQSESRHEDCSPRDRYAEVLR